MNWVRKPADSIKDSETPHYGSEPSSPNRPTIASTPTPDYFRGK